MRNHQLQQIIKFDLYQTENFVTEPVKFNKAEHTSTCDIYLLLIMKLRKNYGKL